MGFLQEVVEKMGLPLEGMGMVGEENPVKMVAGGNLEMVVNLQVEERHEELPVGVLVVMVEVMRLVGVTGGSRGCGGDGAGAAGGRN